MTEIEFRNVRPKSPRPGPKHDPLCLDSPEASGLRYCWCNCPSCWRSEGFVISRRKRGVTIEEHEQEVRKVPKGRCICKFCPCRDASSFTDTTFLNFTTAFFASA